MMNPAEGKSGPSSAGSRAVRVRHPFFFLGVIALSLGLIVFAFLWLGTSGKPSHAYALAPESVLPANIRQSPRSVQEAYRFAIANRDLLRQIPCYCGCGAEHKSNAECYIKDVRPDGSIVFDPMSFG